MKRMPRLLLLALSPAFAALVLSVSAQSVSLGYSPAARPVPLGSTFVDWATLSFRPSPVGLYCAVFDEPTPTLERLEVHITTLRPGMASHTPHHHPWEEMLLIRAGQVEVSINGRKLSAGPGALVFLASNDAHNLTNVGALPATYYVINFYTGAVHSVRDQPASEWAPPEMLSSRVVDCDRLPAEPTKIGSHRKVFDSPTVTFLRLESHITTLNQGESTAPRNRDPGDELFVVKSGTVEATLNRIAHKAGAGSLFYVAPNDERTMRNVGMGPCSYQVIKVVSDKTPPSL
jgi:quercetin dioxygenase-like cupin family protein